MNIALILKKIQKKSLILSGGSDSLRGEYVEKILLNCSYKGLYHFPKNISSMDEYLGYVQQLFPINRIDESDPVSEWSLDQIWDMHLDWTWNTQNDLIVIQEFQQIDSKSYQEILTDFVTKMYENERRKQNGISFRFLITQSSIDSDPYDGIRIRTKKNKDEKRTEDQILVNKLEYIFL